MSEDAIAETVPVLVVGGGASGLATGVFLADAGVRATVIERRKAPGRLPKAHALGQHLMEVFRQHGLADAVYAGELPMADRTTVRWATSLGGDGRLDRRTVHVTDVFGGGSTRPDYEAVSPCMTANMAQSDLEPLLLRTARDRGVAVTFGQEITDLRAAEDHVLVTVADVETGVTRRIRAEYVVAADGGRTVGPALGIAMVGVPEIAHMLSVHFEADLSEWDSGGSLITMFVGPESSGRWDRGVLTRFKGADGGRYEWVFHFALGPDDVLSDEEALTRLLHLLKLPDLNVNVLRTSRWTADAVTAERFQQGRFFLVGDAAHRMPPTGGLGLNTALHDVHNLAWKLAAVLSGQAGPALLDTYSLERQPVAAAAVEWAALNAGSHMFVDPAMGFAPGLTEANTATLDALLSDTLSGSRRRARLAQVMNLFDCEYRARDNDLGYQYSSAAIIVDPATEAVRDVMGCRYAPSAEPGRRLPHAWITHHGIRRSTIDLVGTGQFTALLIGEVSDTGADEVRLAAASLPAPVTVEVVERQHLDDPRQLGAFTGGRPAACLLVRPDGHVSWRASVDTGVGDALRAAVRIAVQSADGASTGVDATAATSGAGDTSSRSTAGSR